MILLLAGTLIAFSSCSKDDDEDGNGDDNPNPPATGSMTCKVDGADWTAGLAVVATKNGTLVTVTGNDSNAKQLQLILYNLAGTGTVDLGGTPTNQNAGRWTAGIGQNDTYTTQLGVGSGTVEVTELTDTSIKGTFQFTAKNPAGTEVAVTDGSFTATFE